MDYPGEPSVITRVLIRGSRRVRVEGDVMTAEVRERERALKMITCWT